MSSALVPASQYSIISATDQLTDVIESNVGSGLTQFDLDRISIPAGGGLSWNVPSLDGEESVKALEGIIVHWKEPRAYWSSSFEDSGGGTPPDCTSDDSVTGTGMFGHDSEHNPTGECGTCPMSQYGSKDGGGQACKQMRVLFTVQPDSLLPQAIVLPPTSIKPMKKYFLRLASRSIPFYGVITRLELERATSGSGIKYSVVKPSLVETLDPEMAASVKEYGDSLRTALNSQIVDLVTANESYGNEYPTDLI